MEALLQSETVTQSDVLSHWAEALAKLAEAEPRLDVAQTHYARACVAPPRYRHYLSF